MKTNYMHVGIKNNNIIINFIIIYCAFILSYQWPQLLFTIYQKFPLERKWQGETVQTAGCRLGSQECHCFTKAGTTQTFTNANIRPKQCALDDV